MSISPSKQPSSSFPSCLRSINWRNFFKSLPTRRTSGNFKRMHANFSCSVVGVDCWVGDRLLELDFDGLLVWSVVYSPSALVIFSWTSSIKLDSVTPWTSTHREREKRLLRWPSATRRRVWQDSSTLFRKKIIIYAARFISRLLTSIDEEELLGRKIMTYLDRREPDISGQDIRDTKQRNDWALKRKNRAFAWRYVLATAIDENRSRTVDIVRLVFSLLDFESSWCSTVVRWPTRETTVKREPREAGGDIR